MDEIVGGRVPSLHKSIQLTSASSVRSKSTVPRCQLFWTTRVMHVLLRVAMVTWFNIPFSGGSPSSHLMLWGNSKDLGSGSVIKAWLMKSHTI